MATKREQIFQSLYTRLQSVAGITAARNREAPATLEEGVVAVLYGQWNDAPLWTNYDEPTDWVLNFGVRLMAAGANVPGAIDAAAGAIHSAILTEPTLGGLAQHIRPVSHTGQTADANGMVSALLDLAFECRYTTTNLDLSA